jgi:hypothetical protein
VKVLGLLFEIVNLFKFFRTGLRKKLEVCSFTTQEAWGCGLQFLQNATCSLVSRHAEYGFEGGGILSRLCSRFGWKADIRSSRKNVASAPGSDISTCCVDRGLTANAEPYV